MGKIAKNIFLTILILSLSASTALLIYLHFFAADNLSGEWSGALDMTPQVTVTALDWLQEMEGISLSLEDMQGYMQNLTVETTMTLEQTSAAEGTFLCLIVPESYEACKTNAYEAFAAAFLDLLAQRLHMAGYTGSTGSEALEDLVVQTFGMSTTDYLMRYAPALLPSIEELQTRYNGSGTYQTADDILIRHFTAGWDGQDVPADSILMESYVQKGDTFVLTADSPGTFSLDHVSIFYPVVYDRKQTSQTEQAALP